EEGDRLVELALLLERRDPQAPGGRELVLVGRVQLVDVLERLDDLGRAVDAVEEVELREGDAGPEARVLEARLRLQIHRALERLVEVGAGLLEERLRLLHELGRLAFLLLEAQLAGVLEVAAPGSELRIEIDERAGLDLLVLGRGLEELAVRLELARARE